MKYALHVLLAVLMVACAAIQKADPSLPQKHCASGQTCPAGWQCPNPGEPKGDCLPPPTPIFTKPTPVQDDDAGGLLLAPMPPAPPPAPTQPPPVEHDGRG